MSGVSKLMAMMVMMTATMMVMMSMMTMMMGGGKRGRRRERRNAGRCLCKTRTQHHRTVGKNMGPRPRVLLGAL